MYSKLQASELRHAFWTAFGQYMVPITSSEGYRINWLNYKTGEKHVQFKMDAGNKTAYIAIEISHPDIDIQQLYFEQFEQLKHLLNNSLQEEWTWKLHATEENNSRIVSRIYKEMNGVSIFNKQDWPALISFFKPRIIALDEFWNNAKYGFEELR